MTYLTTDTFATAWATELQQEFIDAAYQGGGDMVSIYHRFSGEAALAAFLEVVDDQDIDEAALVTSYDDETGIFEIDWSAIDYEVITGE